MPRRCLRWTGMFLACALCLLSPALMGVAAAQTYPGGSPPPGGPSQGLFPGGGGGVAPSTAVGGASVSSGGTLPFTGFRVLLLVLIAVDLIVLGYVIVRAGRARRAATGTA